MNPIWEWSCHSGGLVCLTQCGCVSRVIDDPDESQEDIGFLLECWTVGVTSSHLELSVFTTVKLWIASKSGVCCQHLFFLKTWFIFQKQTKTGWPQDEGESQHSAPVWEIKLSWLDLWSALDLMSGKRCTRAAPSSGYCTSVLTGCMPGSGWFANPTSNDKNADSTVGCQFSSQLYPMSCADKGSFVVKHHE